MRLREMVYFTYYKEVLGSLKGGSGNPTGHRDQNEVQRNLVRKTQGFPCARKLILVGAGV